MLQVTNVDFFTQKSSLPTYPMDRDDVEDIVSDKINTAISSSQNQLLTEMSKLISTEVKKISDNQKSLSELQLSKIASIASSDYKFKRKSNEEQYKVNKKVLEKIDDCDRNLTSSKVQEAKENLAEGMVLFLNFAFIGFCIDFTTFMFASLIYIYNNTKIT